MHQEHMQNWEEEILSLQKRMKATGPFYIYLLLWPC